MAARLSYLTAALLLSSDAVVRYERTDVGAPSGPHDVTIPAGLYLVTGQKPAVITLNNGGNNFSVDSAIGHAIEVGDRVTVWDTSAGVALATGRTVTAADADTVVIDGAVIAPAADDLIWVENDLVSTMWGKIIAAAVAALKGHLIIAVSRSTGIATLRTELTQTGTITWQGAGLSAEIVRDWLRLSGTSHALTTLDPVSGARSCAGVFAPAKPPSKDKAALVTMASVSDVSPAGLQDVVFGATHRLHTLGLHFEGGPRSSSWIEYHALEDLYRRLARGAHVRLYRDRDVRTPWAEQSNPYGWDEWVFDGVAPRWEPAELFAGWYGRLKVDWPLREYVEE